MPGFTTDRSPSVAAEPAQPGGTHAGRAPAQRRPKADDPARRGPGERTGSRESAVRRAPLVISAWAVCTALAALVAWFGVDSVLIPEVAPVALRPAAVSSTTGSALVVVPTPSLTPHSATPKKTTDPRGSATPAGGATKSAGGSPSASASANLQRYTTGGGVVVLDIEPSSASLVSATPASGFSVQSWSAPGWLRVDFSEGQTVYSVYATWNGTSPQVQIVGPSGN